MIYKFVFCGSLIEVRFSSRFGVINLSLFSGKLDRELWVVLFFALFGSWVV